MSIKSLFEDIADAIREKSGSSDTYTPAEMPRAILDLPTGSSTASGVTYDNTASRLTANNVQDAIDELAEDVSTIYSDLSELKYITPDIELTASANMTGQQVIDWLWANIDRTKLTANSIVVLNIHCYRNQYFDKSDAIAFGAIIYANNTAQPRVFNTNGSSSAFFFGSTDVLSTTVVSNGQKIKVFY